MGRAGRPAENRRRRLLLHARTRRATSALFDCRASATQAGTTDPLACSAQLCRELDRRVAGSMCRAPGSAGSPSPAPAQPLRARSHGRPVGTPHRLPQGNRLLRGPPLARGCGRAAPQGAGCGAHEQAPGGCCEMARSPRVLRSRRSRRPGGPARPTCRILLPCPARDEIRWERGGGRGGREEGGGTLAGAHLVVAQAKAVLGLARPPLAWAAPCLTARLVPGGADSVHSGRRKLPGGGRVRLRQSLASSSRGGAAATDTSHSARWVRPACICDGGDCALRRTLVLAGRPCRGRHRGGCRQRR